MRSYSQLLQDNQARDQAITDLTGLVKKSLDSPSGHPPRPDASRPHPIISQELIDGDGNLRASDIGITWAGPDNYLAPHRWKARYCNAHVCLFVCLCVCVFVCLFVRVFAKFQSVISQPFLNRSL